MQTQCANLIIEGTNWANTKDIALELSGNPRLVGKMGCQRYTAVISARWGNFKDFPWGKKLIDFDPVEEEQALKNYGVWTRLIELQRHFNWIIDRFHISTQQYQIQYNDNECDFNWLEERFLKLGFHLVYVSHSAEALESIITNQGKTDIDDEIEKLILEQDTLRKIASKSVLPTLELDISKMAIQDSVNNIVDWFEEVSSYTPPEHSPLDKIFLPSC